MARLPIDALDYRKGPAFVAAGMNTVPVHDYQTGSPFHNLFYRARPTWVNSSFADSDCDYNDDGFPINVGTDPTRVQTVWMTSGAKDDFPVGNYRLSWVGGNGVKPSMSFGGSAAATITDDTNPQHTDYNITSFDGTCTLRIAKADIDASPGGAAAYEADPIRQIELCEVALAGTTVWNGSAFGANLLRQDWIDLYSRYAFIRVMNIAATNQKDSVTTHTGGLSKGSGAATFAHGDYEGGASQPNTGGAPLGVQIEMVNALGIQGWFCIPWEYTDDAVRDWAEQLVAELDPDTGPPIIEDGNEVWNPSFDANAKCQAAGLAEEAATESSPGAGDGRYSGDAFPFWSHYGFRAHQKMNIVQEVFDAAERDFCPVLCLQTGYTGRSSDSTTVNVSEPFNPLSTDRAGDHFPTFGITWYFGHWFATAPNWTDGGALNTTKGGPGNVTNGINQYPDFSEGMESLKYEIESFHTSDQNDTWRRNFEQVFAIWPDKHFVAYEANHHVVEDGTNDGTVELQAFVADYETDEFAGLIRLAARTFEDLGVNSLGKKPSTALFVATSTPLLADRGSHDGYWGAWDGFSNALESHDGTFKMGDSFHRIAGTKTTAVI